MVRTGVVPALPNEEYADLLNATITPAPYGWAKSESHVS